ncbi:MAG: recombinase RecA [Euryarchaeota archaeon]|nr:recombinase RecA [Euryarchaeota archaeon]
MTYKLGISRLDEVIGDIKSGTNIMMIGPPISGKDDIANIIAHQGLLDANAAVIVSTREPGNNVLEWFERYDPDVPMDRIGIVDCVTRTLGFGAPDTDNIKMASSPVDLTGIGVKISQFFEHFWMEMQLRETRLCINSLSTILMYSNLQTVFRFIHVFTGRIKAANALGIYVIEEGMHDDKTIVTLKQLFDGMIEIRGGEEGYQMRAVGFTPKPTPWFDYEIDGANIVLRG